jgi:hypothetical protein
MPQTIGCWSATGGASSQRLTDATQREEWETRIMNARRLPDEFIGYIGKQFVFIPGDIGLFLARVDVMPQSGRRDQALVPFTLIFQGLAGGQLLPEGLYRATVDASSVGEFYVMPIHTPRGDWQDYQAVFN